MTTNALQDLLRLHFSMSLWNPVPLWECMSLDTDTQDINMDPHHIDTVWEKV
jgi:hypothetical protein